MSAGKAKPSAAGVRGIVSRRRAGVGKVATPEPIPTDLRAIFEDTNRQYPVTMARLAE